MSAGGSSAEGDSGSWSKYLDHRPIVVALAGPNGAGKSTFFEAHLKSSGFGTRLGENHCWALDRSDQISPGRKVRIHRHPVEQSERTQAQTPPGIMKVGDMRRRLQEMSAEDLRIVVARLYKLLPKKFAKERGADRLINDPQAFLNSAKVAKLPALPDIDLVEVDPSWTRERMATPPRRNFRMSSCEP